MRMGTNLLHIVLAEENLLDCIRSDKKNDWKKLRENDCRDSFRADWKTNFYLEHIEVFKCVVVKRDKQEPGMLRESFI